MLFRSLAQHLRRHGFTFPAALEGGLVRHQVTRRQVLPTTVLVSAQGQAGLVIPGAMTPEDLLGLVAR